MEVPPRIMGLWGNPVGHPARRAATQRHPCGNQVYHHPSRKLVSQDLEGVVGSTRFSYASHPEGSLHYPSVPFLTAVRPAIEAIPANASHSIHPADKKVTPRVSQLKKEPHKRLVS